MLFFFRTVVAWRRFILVSGLIAAVVMVGISLVLPTWYTATTSIFPPETQSGLGLYSDLLESMQLPLLSPVATGAGRTETIYIEMLLSRTIGEQLIEEYDFKKIYGTELVEETLDELHAHSRFTIMENGLIFFSFEDRDPERAAEVANRFVELLDEFNRRLGHTRASRSRGFIEGQLKEREQTLAEAELALKEFQKENQALELDVQLTSALEIVSQLTGRAIALETELDLLSHYTSKSSDEYQRKKREYDEVISQLSKLKFESEEQTDADMLRAYIPTLQAVPDLALELLRLKREVEIESTVYSMLIQEYERARIEEARDTPTLQVLDRAAVPNLRSRPKRKLLVLIGGVIGLGWSTVLALFVAAWRENRETSRLIREVLAPIISDFSRLFRRR